MQQNEVIIAFDIVLEEIENTIAALNRDGAQAFEGGNYDKARDLMEKGRQMTAFRERVKDLQKEWLNIFATVVPSKPRKRKVPRYQKLQHGLRTPEDEFRIPILQALVELSGTASMNDVLDKVEKWVAHKLNSYDRQTLPSDPTIPRWRNTAQWARAAMVKEGLLSSNSPRGVWEITDSGRRFLEQHK
ncbi:MAG: winged helix-turn-helix domain-containing protein [Anaerolineales bacterium]